MNTTHMRRFVSILILAASTLFGGCALKTLDQIAASAAGAQSKEEQDKALVAIESTLKSTLIDDGLLSDLYGADFIYVSPAQREAMLTDSILFKYSVAAAWLGAAKSKGSLDYWAGIIAEYAGKKGDPAFLQSINELADQFPTVLKLYQDMNGSFVNARLEALKARAGPDFVTKILKGDGVSSGYDAYQKDRLTALLWNDDQFTRFMTDDQYANTWLASSGFSTTRPDGTSILVDMRNNLGPAIGSGGGRTGS